MSRTSSWGFAKWRATYTIGGGKPSDYCIDVNAHALARYAALCQEAGIVPIVEPEVLMDGEHDIERCEDVTSRTLSEVFTALRRHDVLLEGILLKPNMVISAIGCARQADVQEVATRTVRTLLRILETKGQLRHTKEGPRHVYVPTTPRSVCAPPSAPGCRPTARAPG